MPTRMPLVNGILSSPAARMVARRSLGVLGRRALVGDQVGLTDSSISPCEAVTSRRRPRSCGREDAEVGVGQQPALEPLLAGPDDVGGEVLEAPRSEALAHARVMVGGLAREDEQLLDAAARGVVEERVTSSGSWRCGRCVAKAQYLQ